MRVWRWVAAAVAWLFAVAVVAAVTWFAIDSAGRQVAGADRAMTLVAAVQSSPADAATPGTAARTPSPSSTTLGAPGPESGTLVRPSATLSVPASGGGSIGSYSSAGGDVAVQCVGGKAANWTTRVADGWRVEQAASSAAGRLRVIFVTGDGRTAGVEAGCQNGPPAFQPIP